MVVVNTVRSPLGAPMPSKIGSLLDKEVARLIRLKALPKLIADTLLPKAALRIELSRVPSLGYAIDDRETNWIAAAPARRSARPADAFWRRGAFRVRCFAWT